MQANFTTMSDAECAIRRIAASDGHVNVEHLREALGLVDKLRGELVRVAAAAASERAVYETEARDASDRMKAARSMIRLLAGKSTDDVETVIDALDRAVYRRRY